MTTAAVPLSLGSQDLIENGESMRWTGAGTYTRPVRVQMTQVRVRVRTTGALARLKHRLSQAHGFTEWTAVWI